MLIANGIRVGGGPMRFIGGQTALALQRNNQSGAMRNFSDGDAKKAGVPSGYIAPSSWHLPKSEGGMTAFTTVNGSGTISEASLLMGRALTASLTGSGTISEADMRLIVSLFSSLSGSASLTASLRGAVDMAANLAGSGDLSAALGLIAFMSASIGGEGDIIADLRGKLSMSANISVTGGTLTEGGIASAVWSALAAVNNITGTMGEKLNDAGSAGNPWASLLAANNDPNTFGNLVQQIENLVDELHKLQGLNNSAPMTVTPNTRTAGDITLELTGDGSTSTTVTRIL